MQTLTWREMEDYMPESPAPTGANEDGDELAPEEFEQVLEEQRQERAEMSPAWATVPDDALGLD